MPPFFSIFFAAFLGCLLALATGRLLSVTARAPLASLARRQFERRPDRGAGIDDPDDLAIDPPTLTTRSLERLDADQDVDIHRARRPSTARPAERRPEEWTDDWGEPLPSSPIAEWTDAEHGTLWISADVPAGRRVSLPAGSVVVVRRGDAGIGKARRGPFRGREIEVDPGCAGNFAICDILVKGRSQLWPSGCARGEIPAESFTREPYGVLTMEPAFPEDAIEIVVRNVGKSSQAFLAGIRGEYRAPEGSPNPVVDDRGGES